MLDQFIPYYDKLVQVRICFVHVISGLVRLAQVRPVDARKGQQSQG